MATPFCFNASRDIGSEGHSGRHLTGFWDTVIDGEAWYYGEGQFEKSVYKPGDRIYVGPGQARAMNFTNGVWAVEYARGIIPYSVPFGIADELLSCFDWVTATQTLTLYTDLVCQDIGRRHPSIAAATSLVGGLARRITHKLTPPPEVPSIPRERRAADQAARPGADHVRDPARAADRDASPDRRGRGDGARGDGERGVGEGVAHRRRPAVPAHV